jgi:DnaJ-class molecular chaperone
MARTGVCNDCRGTGVVVGGVLGGSDSVVCPSCMGSGTRVTDTAGAVADIIVNIDAIKVILAEHTASLDYIHGKVTAIWNAVKPGN